MSSTALSPAALISEADVARFNQDGFLVYDDVFTPEEIATLQNAVESKAVNNLYKTSTSTIHQLALTEQDPAFVRLAKDERILNILRKLLGNDLQIQHSKLAAKPLARGQGPFGWHQDFAFFPHTNTDLIAVMVMLDDATPENGCMSMVRGSHKLGLLNHSGEDGYFYGFCQDPSHWEDHPENVAPITPRAGGISVHHCLTLHGSPANLSGKPRRGLLFQYRVADAYQLAEDVCSDTGLIVSGSASEYPRCTSGVVRLPKFRRDQGFDFGSAWNQVGAFAAKINAEQ